MKRVKGGRSYLVIDNRASGGTLQEWDTLTCAHHGGIVVLNPERKRKRGYCRKCNAYICDLPGCNAECNPIVQCVDLAMTFAGTGEPFLPRGYGGETLFDPRYKEQTKLYLGGGATDASDQKGR